MKRILKIFIGFVVCLTSVTALFGFAGCEPGNVSPSAKPSGSAEGNTPEISANAVGSISEETALEICEAYAAKNDNLSKITLLDDLGTYNGNIAVLLNLAFNDTDVPTVAVDIYIEETFVGSVGDASYKIIVYTTEKECLTLEKAYEGNYITDADIPTFVEKAQASSHIQEIPSKVSAS